MLHAFFSPKQNDGGGGDLEVAGSGEGRRGLGLLAVE